MRQAAKYSALGFSATCFCLAADAAVGLGTAQWLADLCLTDTADDMSGMAMSTVEVTPAPFLAMSTIFAGFGVGLLATEDREAALGKTPPDAAEYAGVLSAIVLVASVDGRTNEQDIANVFQIVTGTSLEPELARLAYQRFKATDPETISADGIEPSNSALSRRRILAAALMTGCVANEASHETSELVEDIALKVEATPGDVAAARAALQSWTNNDSGLSGAPLITLLRTKPLGLRPA